MKKLLFLMAFISFMGMNAKADGTFTNITNCDLTITFYCIECNGGGEEVTWLGTQTVSRNGGTLGLPNFSCGYNQYKVAKICYADCPTVCSSTWVNMTQGVPVPPNCLNITDTYEFPPSLCTCTQDIGTALSQQFSVTWTGINTFVAGP